MRLAFFSYGLPVEGQKRGGIERVTHALAQGLAERGHEVVVFSHDEKPARASYQVSPLPWKRFVNTWFGRRATMGYLGNVLATLPDYRGFDVVVASGDSLLLPFAHRPVLRIMHGSAWGEAMSARSVGRFVLQSGVYVQELASALFQTTVGVSENTRRFNPFVKRTIMLGADPATFYPAPADKSVEPSLIFVGTAAGRKRGRWLLELFAKAVRPAFPTSTLVFVGPPGEPMPGVSYHTGISDEQLGALYRRAWLYASPSAYEGFGLPYLEAMASGTAVVATPNPGSREVCEDGAYGVLADDNGFAGAVVTLLGDVGTRHKMEAAGLRRARQLSQEAMLDGYESLLAEMCKGHVKSAVSA